MITGTIKNLETLDYIFLVNKASDNRLVGSVKSVYEKIQDMFAVNVADRFVVMCTFSDGKEPLAKAAIEASNFKAAKFLKFNNSAIFEKGISGGNIDKTTYTFFDLGYKNFKDFSDWIIKERALPVSMTVTKNVIEQRDLISRKALECSRTSSSLVKTFASLEKTIKYVRSHQQMIDKSKNYKVHYTETEAYQVTVNHNVT